MYNKISICDLNRTEIQYVSGGSTNFIKKHPIIAGGLAIYISSVAATWLLSCSFCLVIPLLVVNLVTVTAAIFLGYCLSGNKYKIKTN